MVLRFVLSLLVFARCAIAAFAATSASTAQPMIELCPAHAGVMQMATPKLYRFDLVAASPRTVSGSIALQTDKGWFRVPFGAVNLSPTTVTFVEPNGKLRPFTSARSPVQYVAFGEPVNINFWYIESAATNVADWASVGLFSCYFDPSIPRMPKLFADSQKRYQSLPAAGQAIEAKPIAPLFRTDCTRPYLDAKAVHPALPVYPFAGRMPTATAQVEVMILPDGRPVDAKVFVSSGIDAFDVSAINAAKQTTYTPRVAYCHPTVGLYLFKVTFSAR